MKLQRQKILPAILLICLGTCAFAQRRDDAQRDSQFWPDTTATIKLDKNLSLVLFGTVRLGRDDTAQISRQGGIGLSRSFNRYLSGAVQYRFIHNEPTPNKLSNEHRIFAEVTTRMPLKFGFQISDRNRIEWRDINGQGSWRYRNRLQFERPFSVRDRKITPYIAGEPMYDTRYKTWNRTQAYLGARVPIVRHFTLDGFYMKQWDARTKPGFLHVIGTFIRLDF